MSRIGKQILLIPPKTEVSVSADTITVKGPHGELKRSFRPNVNISVQGDQIKFEPKDDSIEARAAWGTYAAHVSNMIEGVNKLFTKTLVIEGVGYKWELVGDTISLNIGFSHPVKIQIPKTLKVSVDKSGMVISGADIEEVGSFAASLRAKKPPEPYKGKGIRYKNEVVRRKEGKKTA